MRSEVRLRAGSRRLIKQFFQLMLAFTALTLASCNQSGTSSTRSNTQVAQVPDSSLGAAKDDEAGSGGALLSRAKELQLQLSSQKQLSASEKQQTQCEIGESLRKAASLGDREAKLLYISMVAKKPTSDLSAYCLDASPDTLREVETYIAEISIAEKTNTSLQSSLLDLSEDIDAKSKGIDDPESSRKSRHK
jgi:hypothetical protein